MRPTPEPNGHSQAAEPRAKLISGGVHRPKCVQDLIPTSVWVRLDRVRKLVFISFVALGALVGLISAANDDWPTRAVMMGIGALFGAPIGAVLARIGKQRQRLFDWDDDLRAGAGTSPRSLAANYWRDKGHPPFAKPPEAEADAHMFDPDKLG